MIETTWNLFFDGWIIAVAATCAVACGLPGCFLVLRRQSMMGDALSHAVLPGIAIGYLATGSRANWIMFTGAIIAALLTVFLTQWLGQRARVDRGAAMGVVFTTLFALGIVLIVRGANSVELEPHCVLFGALELTPLNLVSMGGLMIPQAFVVLCVVLIINFVLICLFFKELRISSFDPDLAASQGMRPTLIHYVLMAMTAVTAVAAFESVGSIIVVAMLVVPASAAKLMARNLGQMVCFTVLLAVGCALLGHYAAVAIPHRFGFGSVPTSGGMAFMAGVLLLAVIILNPRGGLIATVHARWSFFLRTTREDLLALAWRLEERNTPPTPQELRSQLQVARGASGLVTRLSLAGLIGRKLVERDRNLVRLTPHGRDQASQLVRSHRLWEAWLARTAGIAPDHVHDTAMRLEHVTDEQMLEELFRETGAPKVDPHGRPIPGSRE